MPASAVTFWDSLFHSAWFDANSHNGTRQWLIPYSLLSTTSQYGHPQSVTTHSENTRVIPVHSSAEQRCHAHSWIDLSVCAAMTVSIGLCCVFSFIMHFHIMALNDYIILGLLAVYERPSVSVLLWLWSYYCFISLSSLIKHSGVSLSNESYIPHFNLCRIAPLSMQLLCSSSLPFNRKLKFCIVFANSVGFNIDWIRVYF